MNANQRSKIMAGALDVAAAAPEKRHIHTHDTRIPWSIVEQIRRDLEAAGIDWLAYKRRHGQ